MLLRFIFSNLKYYIHTPKITSLQCATASSQPELHIIKSLENSSPSGPVWQGGPRWPLACSLARRLRALSEGLSCHLPAWPLAVCRRSTSRAEPTFPVPLPAPGRTAVSSGSPASPPRRPPCHPEPSLVPASEGKLSRPRGYNVLTRPEPGVADSGYSSLGKVLMPGDRESWWWERQEGLGWGGSGGLERLTGTGGQLEQPTLHARHIRPRAPGAPRSELGRGSTGPSAGTSRLRGRRAGEPQGSLDRRQHLFESLLALQHHTHLGEGQGACTGDRGAGREWVGGSSWPLPLQRCFLRAGGYLSPVLSGRPASSRAARNCVRTPRTLLMKPLDSGKRGKPMSG